MNAESIVEAHRVYQRETGLDLPYSENHHSSDWYLFLKQHNVEDIPVVVRHLKFRYRSKPDILASMLRFRHLIRCSDYFSEYLAEAKAYQRAKTHRDRIPDGKREVLLATSRETERLDSPSRPVRELIEELKKAAGMTT
jgi:hypothetical protein